MFERRCARSQSIFTFFQLSHSKISAIYEIDNTALKSLEILIEKESACNAV